MKKRFKNVGGVHIMPDGKQVGHNKTVVTHQDLRALHGDKFTYMGDVQEDELKGKGKKKIAESDGTLGVTAGLNVSEKFEDADNAGYVIYYVAGKGYNVVDPDIDPNEALNEKRLKKKEVAPFVDTLLEE